MTLIKIERFRFSPNWTLSRVYVNGIQNGYCIEDEIRHVKLHGETAIPFGNFQLKLRQSPSFSASFLYSDAANLLIEAKDKGKHPNIKDFRNHDLIWIDPIPNFGLVLIHWGNTDLDSDGCLIVGAKMGVLSTHKGKPIEPREGVVESRIFYKALYPKLYPLIKAGNQTIEITKDPGLA